MMAWITGASFLGNWRGNSHRECRQVTASNPKKVNSQLQTFRSSKMESPFDPKFPGTGGLHEQGHISAPCAGKSWVTIAVAEPLRVAGIHIPHHLARSRPMKEQQDPRDNQFCEVILRCQFDCLLHVFYGFICSSALKSGEWVLRFLLIIYSSFVEIIKQKITPYFWLPPVLRMGYSSHTPVPPHAVFKLFYQYETSNCVEKNNSLHALILPQFRSWSSLR